MPQTTDDEKFEFNPCYNVNTGDFGCGFKVSAGRLSTAYILLIDHENLSCEVDLKYEL